MIHDDHLRSHEWVCAWVEISREEFAHILQYRYSFFAEYCFCLVKNIARIDMHINLFVARFYDQSTVCVVWPHAPNKPQHHHHALTVHPTSADDDDESCQGREMSRYRVVLLIFSEQLRLVYSSLE